MQIIVKAIIALVIALVCFFSAEIKVGEFIVFLIILYCMISWFWMLFKVIPLGIVLRTIIAFVVMVLCMGTVPELLRAILPEHVIADVLIAIICCIIYAVPVVLDVINVRNKIKEA